MSRRIALFAGSFDPYTNGHHAIVRKAAALFDEVVVLIGVNVNKKRAFDAGAMRDAIQAALDADALNARAVIHGGLVADYCAAHGIRWYVRGLRNAADYQYEEVNAPVNRLLNPDLETIYLRGDDCALSSSMVRELMAFGHCVDAYLPVPVRELIPSKTKETSEKA
uniref:Phosphopantetheine adenylyltransferase n=1 Tax=uncultured bacterium Contig1480 TaxID=1393435 RepID=W0FUY6_9BACT|nr:pantetheine-phosphate adenylyltransferase [uncultured bacterium Contig1480]